MREDPDRAEHIRLDDELFEVRLARWIAGIEQHDVPAWPPGIGARLEELRTRNAERWAGPELVALAPSHIGLSRGSVSGLALPGDLLVRHADLLDRHPIESLTLLPSSTPLADVLALPLIARLSTLSLWRLHPSRSDYEALGSCEALERCVVLQLPFNHDVAVPAVLASPRLREIAASTSGETRDVGDGTGLWISDRAAAAEREHGLIPAVRRRVWTDPVDGRLVRALEQRGLAERMIDRRAPVGCFRPIYRELYSQSDPVDAIFRLLDERGYVESSRARLSYALAKDGAPGWAGWVYYLDLLEHDDAPIAADIDRLCARR